MYPSVLSKIIILSFPIIIRRTTIRPKLKQHFREMFLLRIVRFYSIQLFFVARAARGRVQ